MSNLLYDINDAIIALTESLVNGEIDEQSCIDTIENLGAENAIEDVVKSILNLEAEAEAIKMHKMKLDSKQKHTETAIVSLRKVLIKYMELTKQAKVKAGAFSVTKGSTQSVELLYDDVEKYPSAYLIAQKPKIDKRKMLADLKDGKELQGACIKSTEYVKIK